MTLELSGSKKPIERIQDVVDRLRRECETTPFGIALLGSSEKGLEERREIKRAILDMNPATTVLIPEDDLPKEVNPVIAERVLLASGDIGLVFISVNSWGSATEFGEFSENRKIAPKLRVLVSHEYHPLHAFLPHSFLTDAYLVFMVKFGHVYAVRGSSDLFPTSKNAVTILTEISRQVKYLNESTPDGEIEEK